MFNGVLSARKPAGKGLLLAAAAACSYYLSWLLTLVRAASSGETRETRFLFVFQWIRSTEEKENVAVGVAPLVAVPTSAPRANHRFSLRSH